MSEEEIEAKRLIQKFGNSADLVAEELKRIDVHINKYFWDSVINIINNINLYQ
jgi:hypothetical protein